MKTILKYSVIFFIVGFSYNKSWALTLSAQTAILDSYAAEEQKNFSGAIEKITPLLKSDPSDYFLNLRLGWLFFEAKKYKNAINHYTAAAKIMPQSVEPLLGESLVYNTIADFNQALASAKNILKLDPLNLLGKQRMIQAYIGMKDFTNAIKEANEGLKGHPTDAVFLEQKGFALAESGQTESAKQTLGYLLLISPKNIYARTILGSN